MQSDKIMQPPDWLTAFPYLHSQWSEIVGLTAEYPTINEYDLQQDWYEFISSKRNQTSAVDWFKSLRQFRKSRLGYLAYHDLFSTLDNHLQTMLQVSDLADLLIQSALQVATAEMTVKYGKVIDETGQPVEMMIWALGKLGSRELNYSSDVDLVFLYLQSGQSDGKRTLDAESYFTRLGQKIIKLLDHYTHDGQVYRVDMRLRPFGSAGPLVCSMAALQQYLQYEGREWERFAWMRARLVNINPQLEITVLEKINAFIYRKHLDYTVFNSLAKIKTEIADQINYPADDLKQGAGGIRAVEFIVQSLQLVFGGRNKRLQGTSVSQQIQQLVNAGKITAKDGQRLNQAWLWLRKLENISHSVADQNSHTIPDCQAVKQVICDILMRPSWDVMALAINEKRHWIAVFFQQMFSANEAPKQLADEQKVHLQKFMSEIKGRRIPRQRQDNIEQLLHNSLQLADEPVVAEFLLLIKKILTRPNYILMLLREDKVHRTVLELMSKHQYFRAVLQRYPVLLEQLFERTELYSEGAEALAARWQLQAPENTEAWMEALRYFKLELQFNGLMAWSEKRINPPQVMEQMTQLAEFVLAQVIHFSHQEMVVKMGDSGVNIEQIIVVAYGSAATREMTAGSDLDLVFIFDSDHWPSTAHVFVQKWVRRIIHHLTTPMYHGKLYDLDMQLRPNGNSGALITTKKQFEQYQKDQAWVWEHAAMIKSTAVFATPVQQQWYADFRTVILQQQRDADAIDQALTDMAARLNQQQQQKAHQVEFKILAGVLKHSHTYPELTDHIRSTDIQNQMLELGLLDTACSVSATIKKDPAS